MFAVLARSDSFASHGVVLRDGRASASPRRGAALKSPFSVALCNSAHRQAAALPAALGTGGTRRTRTLVFGVRQQTQQRSSRPNCAESWLGKEERDAREGAARLRLVLLPPTGRVRGKHRLSSKQQENLQKLLLLSGPLAQAFRGCRRLRPSSTLALGKVLEGGARAAFAVQLQQASNCSRPPTAAR